MSPFETYRPFLAGLPMREKYETSDLIVPDLLFAEDRRLSVYYCPFDWQNRTARVIILGITPGFTQMELAVRGARDAIAQGKTADDVCLAAKMHGSFAGPMRRNLVSMLDTIGLNDVLGIESAGLLFGQHRHLLHTASAIRYPVFKGIANYSGQSPSIVNSPMLMRLAREILAPELALVPGAAIIPLGKSVEQVLEALTREGLLESRRWLAGFPHPSGANGHRARIFEKNRAHLAEQLRIAIQ
jgi:hypothetical protein